MSRHPTGRHEGGPSAGSILTCALVVLLAILLVSWAIGGGP